MGRKLEGQERYYSTVPRDISVIPRQHSLSRQAASPLPVFSLRPDVFSLSLHGEQGDPARCEIRQCLQSCTAVFSALIHMGEGIASVLLTTEPNYPTFFFSFFFLKAADLIFKLT